MRKKFAVLVGASVAVALGATAGNASAFVFGAMGGKGTLTDTKPSSAYSGTASFAYVLDCETFANPVSARQNPLEARFGGYAFKTTAVTFTGCGLAGEGSPFSTFDTLNGTTDGTLKRPNGSTVAASASFSFFDGGAGPNDRSSLQITDAANALVLDVSGAPGKLPGSRQATGENTAVGDTATATN